MRRIALTLSALLTACTTPGLPPPCPPVWALSTVPDDATPNQQLLYLLAENAQREAYTDELIARWCKPR